MACSAVREKWKAANAGNAADSIFRRLRLPGNGVERTSHFARMKADFAELS
jgi:hypothetical protein